MAIAKVMTSTTSGVKYSWDSTSALNCKSKSLKQDNSKKYCYKIKDQGTEDSSSKFMGVDVRAIAKICVSTPIEHLKDSSGKSTNPFQKLKGFTDTEVVHTSKRIDKELFVSKFGKSFELVKTSYLFELKLKCTDEQPAHYASPHIEDDNVLVNSSYIGDVTYPV